VKRALASAAAIAIFLSLAVWLVVRGDVARLRASDAVAEPVPRVVAAAILAAEDPFILRRPEISWRSLLPASSRTLHCGPSPLAYMLVRSPGTPQLVTAVRAYVVGRLFTPDELPHLRA
jgi:hypothetical protein